MNYTLARREQEGSMLLPDPNREKSHYWHVERKARRGSRWIFVRDLMATKSEAADVWNKRYRGRKDYRLRHKLTYRS